MRGYVRLSPRWGASLPWWLALIVGAMWLTLMLLYVAAVMALGLLILAGRYGARGWAGYQARRRPPG